MKIAVSASQVAGNQTDLTVLQGETANQRKAKVLQLTRISKQSDKRVKNG